MFGLQPAHILLILIVALLIFGPSLFSGFGDSIRRTFTEFRSGMKETREDPESQADPKKAKPKS